MDRPFDKGFLDIAKGISEKYGITLFFEDGQYYGKGVELPNVFADGKTKDECIKNTRQALLASTAHLLELGQSVPKPRLNKNAD